MSTTAITKPTIGDSRIVRVLILLLAILAFALRVYQLDAKSLWFDESHSLNRASLDLLSIASGKQMRRARSKVTRSDFRPSSRRKASALGSANGMALSFSTSAVH